MLTTDRPLISNYHNNEFLGFGTTAPPNVVPERFFKALFFPPIKTVKGIPTKALYELRKIEAQLLNEGFKVLTVDPDNLKSYIDKTNVLDICIICPLNIGSASSIFAKFLKTREPYVAKHFRLLLEKLEVKEAKRRGPKIIAGSPSVWQLKLNPIFMDTHGIVCIIDGEAEKVVGRIFKAAIKGEELSMFYKVKITEVVKTATGIMTNNNLIPACTLITGLPQETEEDVIKTIELMDDLKDFKSLTISLFFVLMDRLKNGNWFTMEQMNDLQMELPMECLRHDICWMKIMMKSYFKEKWYSKILSLSYWIFVKSIERKAKNVYTSLPFQKRFSYVGEAKI